MLFPTVTFAAFFMVVWPASWVLGRWPVARQLLLLAASWVFYARWDVRYLSLLAATIVVNHAAAQAIGRWAAHPAAVRAALWSGVGAHLAVLAWFKYYGFFVQSLTSALDRLGMTVEPRLVQVVLPLGISFFTFQAISHLIEVRRGVIAPASLLEVATWLSFFPTVASGPITRASELVPQLRARPERRIDAHRAFWLILRGLFKKVVLASFLASGLASDVFTNPARFSAIEVLVGIYAFAIQLYVDFSGYSDIAIGCALLLGFRIPENFDAPYAARSVTEFWSRWHMTLTRWLRDFVFTPLAHRSRSTTAATCRNLVIVMLLTGLWHGPAWTFVAFGAVHGVAMAGERITRQRARRLGRPVQPVTALGRLGRRVLTFHVVCLGWVLFRAESIAQAGAVLVRLGSGWASPAAISWLLVLVVVTVVALQQLPPRLGAAGTMRLARIGPAPAVVLLAAGLVAVDLFGPAGIAPFIYFGF